MGLENIVIENIVRKGPIIRQMLRDILLWQILHQKYYLKY